MMNKRTTMTYAVAAATAVTLLLSGCNGGDKDPTGTPTATGSSTKSASPSGTPTTSSSPSPSSSVTPPSAARVKSNEGAIAFVRFYFDQVNEAYLKPDPALLPGLATKSCQSCNGLQDGVLEISSAGQRMKSKLVAPISSASIGTEAPAGQTWVKFTLNQLTVPVIDKTGQELPGQQESSVPKIVSVVWEGSQWRVNAIANQS